MKEQCAQKDVKYFIDSYFLLLDFHLQTGASIWCETWGACRGPSFVNSGCRGSYHFKRRRHI